ncbi:amino acid adenylation domain-containing protein [Streptomyces sp. NPDC001262]|uniref:amino acid adenylation domain-containing protein n=1 Tax=Streptomyces sp. NPDC001262 TaxID=3364552 RepID=UPI00369D8CC0
MSIDDRPDSAPGPHDSGDSFPASREQRRMYFLHRLEDGGTAYHMPVFHAFDGPVDGAVLAECAQRLLDRHEALRTRFALQDGELLQVVDDDARLVWHTADAAGAEDVERWMEAEHHRPFDLHTGPLFRAGLLTAPDSAYLVLNMHHIVADGWSVGVMMRELLSDYAALTGGGAPDASDIPDAPDEEPGFQYADYAAWQEEWLDSPAAQRRLAYWAEQLAGELPQSALPRDHRSPAPGLRDTAALHEFPVPAPALDALRALCRETGSTLYTGMLAAFQVLMSRYTGQDDVLVGTPVANRNRQEFQDTVGLFVNTVVIRSDLADGPSFREHLERVRDTVLDAQDHQDLPFERIVEHLNPERTGDGAPLFHVMFGHHDESGMTQGLPGPRARYVEGPAGSAKFDLTFDVVEGDDGVRCRLEYHAGLYEAATVERFARHYRRLLEEATARPALSVHELPMLADDERRALGTPLPATDMDTDTAADPGPCAHELFARHAARTPDAVALVHEGTRLTYRELDRQANRIAHRLRALGVGPDTLVGLCIRRSPELVTGLLGILKAGGAYLPLDPDNPPERLRYIIGDAQLTHLVGTSDTAALWDGLPLHAIDLTADAASLAAEPETAPETGVTPDHLAYAIYTSGSTGRPKGTLIPHRNITRLFSATDHWFGFGPDDVWTLFHSVAFDFSVWELWGALAHGGRLVVVPYGTSRSPEDFHRLLRTEQVTVLNQTPSAFYQLARADALHTPDGDGELALRYVVFGGEALDVAALAPWFDRHPDTAPQLVNMYGITETTVHVTYRPLTARDAREGRGSVIGVPIPDLRLHLLDRHGRPVPPGVAGELFVGGAGLARGYLGRPGLTAERFPADASADRPGDRLYRTGDLARVLADGELEYLGRIDDQVKIRGFRIELGEVEAALAAHPLADAAVVLVRPDATGADMLVGYVAVASGTPEGEPGVEALRKHLAERIPSYMIPAAFVLLPGFPLTPNGKVDRRRLPDPALAAAGADTAYEPPRGPVETVLAEVWQQVLGRERVGANDNYFALGGDSIRSIRLLARARERGLEFTVADVMRHQTVRRLAAVATASGTGTALAPFALLSDEDRAALPDGLDDAYPMTRLQAGMLFHSDLPADGTLYHNVASLHVRAAYDEQAWRDTVALLARRHDMLRTSFELTGFGEPLQLVHRDAAPVITFEDLTALDEDGQRAAVAARYEAERRRPFDWRQAPLLRFHVQRRSGGTFQLFMAEHHAVMDGWSERSLFTELSTCYLDLLAGRDATAEGPRSRFASFVALERAALDSGEQQRFWAEQTADMAVTRLPRLRQADGPARMSWHLAPLPDGLHPQLAALARESGVPLRTVLLAAHLRVMALLGGTDDVTTGAVFNGRTEETDGDRTVGIFLNTLPFRLTLPDGDGRAFVRAVAEQDLRIQEHRRYPLAEIVRTAGGTALFETFFNFTHFHVEQQGPAAGDFAVLAEDGEAGTDFAFGAEFSVTPDGERLELGLRYDAAQFTEEQIAAAHGYYATALGLLADAPDADFLAADLLSEAEHRTLAQWNATDAAYDAPHLLHRLIEQQTGATPDAPAVRFEGRSTTYRELDAQAGRLAAALREHGAGPGTFVGVLLERSHALPAALLGILKSGAAYVPLDPGHPEPRVTALLAEAGIGLVVTDERWTEPLQRAGVRAVRPDAAASHETPGSAAGPDDPAYMIFTSGSTGKPKGVVVSHRAIANRLLWMQDAYALHPVERVLQKTPYTFDVSVWEFFWPLMTGATLVLARPGGQRDPAYLAGLIQEERISTVHFVPSMLSVFLEEPAAARCTGLTRVVCSGEALPYEVQSRFFERLPDAGLHNLYGPTEAAVDVTYWSCHEDGTGVVPIGRPIANMRTHVLDRRLQEVPLGVTGELYLEGVGLAHGYHGQPELTAERFVTHTGRDGAARRLYRTGDLARHRPGGELEYAGRTDHQLKIRGFRVEPGEIEAVLTDHEAVRECAVLLRGERLTAYVVAVTGHEADPAGLAGFARQHLPEYMVPAAWVALDALPLTANGKLDRAALPEPDATAVTGGRIPAPPRDETESRLIGIWERLLDGGPVGIHDDFFAVGGHSIAALRLIGSINEEFGERLSVSAVLEHPTVARQAALLGDTARRTPDDGVVRLRPGGDRPPLFLLHPVGGHVFCYRALATALGTGRPVHGLTAPGLAEDAPEPQPRTVEDLAAAHVRALRRVQPAGPYHLAGWSFGGLLAYEAAAQLRAAGEEVAGVALLDSSYPDPQNVPGDEAGMLEWFYEDLARAAGSDFGDASRSALRAALEAASDAGDRLKALAAQAAEEQIAPGLDAARLARHYAVFRTGILAAAQYRPPVLAGPVLLHQSTDGAALDSARRWAARVDGGLTVHDSDADHYTLMRFPHITAVADTL